MANSGCSPPVITPNNPSIADGNTTGVGDTRLVLDPGDAQRWSANRETDARTAMTRGLAEYIRDLNIDFNGANYRFRSVLQTWSEPEQVAEYPSAVIYARGAGNYDATNFTPNINRDDKVYGVDGLYIQFASELDQEFIVEVWANNPEERQALVAMLEDALVPVDWRYGPLLELPHYFNARASFEKLNLSYEDGEVDAIRRYRRAIMAIKGKVPVVKIVNLPFLNARLDLEVSDDSC